jgi:hypothetical protein
MARAIQRLRFEPEIEPAALACPFCGAAAMIQYWHGGRPSKRMISCSGQGDTLMRGRRPITCHVAPCVTGENRAEALRRWNARAAGEQAP